MHESFRIKNEVLNMFSVYNVDQKVKQNKPR